jgi:GNAT superfamily N-acetyltransferase
LIKIKFVTIPTKIDGFTIRQATESDVPQILRFIKDLAEYEKLSHEVIATEGDFRQNLFGEKQFAEVVIGESHSEPVGYALYFYNFSTFIGKPGIYLEDLYVKPEERGKGFGKALLAYLARLAIKKDFGRLEWAVLDWNEPSINFYKSIGATLLNEWIINRVTGDNLVKLSDEF